MFKTIKVFSKVPAIKIKKQPTFKSGLFSYFSSVGHILVANNENDHEQYYPRTVLLLYPKGAL